MTNSNQEFLASFENYDLPLLGLVRLPKIEITTDQRKRFNAPENCTNLEFLRHLALSGFQDKLQKGKIDPNKAQQYTDRCKYELDTIEELGFTDYILLVWDVIDFCRQNNIATGNGRGSIGGSLLAYLIDMTKVVDPLKYGLIFERFVSKARAKKKIINGVTYIEGDLAPDVDCDISIRERSKVIDYLNEKYKGRTAKLLTLSTLQGKILIKETGKTLAEKSEDEMISVADLLPKHFGNVMDIEEAYNTEVGFKKWCDNNKEVYQCALELRNLTKNKGSHASGYAISYDLIENVCPLELNSNKELTTSYDMTWINRMAIKLDLLGLRCVTHVDLVCKLLGIKIEDINIEDPFIYENLQNLISPYGLFQIEADTNFRVTQKVKPKNLKELSAVLALARPGALDYVKQYAKYTETGKAESVHPFFDDILKETASIPLYQEQLMKMLNKIGFTLDEAEIARKIVGKKKLEEVKEWEEKIHNKVKENKLDPEIGNVVWKLLNDSAKYSFNYSHSLFYASLSAATIYLKFKHPKEFFLALLELSKEEPNPFETLQRIEQELKYFNITLLPPHLLKSDLNFKIEGSGIRFGLSSIKGISDKTVEKLLLFKKEHANKFDLFGAAKEAGLSSGVLNAIIGSGTIDDGKTKRTKMMLEAALWWIMSEKERGLAKQFGSKFDYNLIEIIKYLKDNVDTNGKFYIKPSRYETIKKRYQKPYLMYETNRQYEKLCQYCFEKAFLGFVYSVSLKEIFNKANPNLSSTDEVISALEGDRVEFVGMIENIEESKTKRDGKRYHKFLISDEKSTLMCILYDKKIDKNLEYNNGNKPKEGQICLCKGNKKGTNTVFLDSLAVQSHPVFLKASEIKDEDLTETT